MKNKRIFISGGAGVIGREIVSKLFTLNNILMVGDIKSKPNNFSKKIIYRQGNLNELTEEELILFRPEIIIHLAATFERSNESYEFWNDNFSNNIELSHHLMTIAKNIPTLKRYVFASSYLIYDPSLYQSVKPKTKAAILKEKDQILPRNLIGMSKLAHEAELQFIGEFKSTKFSIVCARIFRGYGKNSRDIISRWVRALLKKEKITIYNPEGIFDYIYASDSAEGLIRIADKSKLTGIINLGTGKSRAVKDIINILRLYFPKMNSILENPKKLYEASEADMTKFQKYIKWMPFFTLEKAIPKIIKYEKDKITKPKTPNNKLKILVSNSGNKVTLIQGMKTAALKFDQNAKIIAGDISSESITKYVADEFWEMPTVIDRNLKKIIKGCLKKGITAVLPTRDGELLFWSRNSKFFSKNGISIMTSKNKSISICIDKIKFSKFGIVNKLPFIPSSLNPDLIGVKKYVIKERFGSGSKNIAINKTKDEAIKISKHFIQPIFQPYIEGIEISADAWLDSKNLVKGLVIRKREVVINGESQTTSTFKNTKIEQLIKKILEKLKLYGPVVLQAIITKNKKIKIIECNARFGGASNASIAVGLDSLYWTILESKSINSKNYNFLRLKNEIKQVRISKDIYFKEYDSNF